MSLSEARELLEYHEELTAIIYGRQQELDITPGVSSMAKVHGRGRPADPTASQALRRIESETEVTELLGMKIRIERAAEHIGDDAQRRLLFAVYFRGQTPNEVAEVLGLSDRQYDRLYARALKAFAVEFERLQLQK